MSVYGQVKQAKPESVLIETPYFTTFTFTPFLKLLVSN